MNAKPNGKLFGDKGPRMRVERHGSWARATFNGEVVAESEEALVLHESGYPPRFYFPMKDVRLDLLTPSQKRTHCPHKGDAIYWTLRVGALEAADALWAYPEPLPEVAEIAGHACFTDAVAVES